MSRRSWFRPIALLLLLVGAVGAGYLLFRPITPAAVGVAPEFRLSTTDGRHIALSDYRGRSLRNLRATGNCVDYSVRVRACRVPRTN